MREKADEKVILGYKKIIVFLYYRPIFFFKERRSFMTQFLKFETRKRHREIFHNS